MIDRRNKKRKLSRRGPLPNLPPEIWAEVLSRIPVRNLVLMRSVCKLFASLVPFDPLLADLHIRRHQGQSDGRIRRFMVLEQRPAFLSVLNSAVLQPACPENLNAASLNFNCCIFMTVGLKYTHIIPSCRGVVGVFGKDMAFLCNPATGEWLCFSKPYCTRRGAMEMLHIGWDALNGVFKAVRLCSLKEIGLRLRHNGLFRMGISLTCEICTLDKDTCISKKDFGIRREANGKNGRRYLKHLKPCWTAIADSTSPLVHISPECFHGDGILCWGVRDFPSARGLTSILSLNLTKQEFETIPLPEFFHSPSGYTTFQELDGCMSVIFWPANCRGTIEIWMLKDMEAVSDKNSWFRRCCIQLQRLSMGGLVDLLAMWDDRIIYSRYKGQQKSLFYFDLLLEESVPVPWKHQHERSDQVLQELLSSNLISVCEESLAPIIRGRGARDGHILSYLPIISRYSYRQAKQLED